MAHEIREGTGRDAEGLAARGIEAYLAGERESLRHGMEAAACWHRYLTMCMAHAPEKGARAIRAEAVARLERELASRTGRAVRVNELLRAWGAWAALAEGQKLVVPLHAFRDTWALLIERRDKDTAREHWALLEGTEGECRALFRRCVEGRVPLREARGLVRQLAVEHACRQAAARRAEVDRLTRELKQAEVAGARGQIEALRKALAVAEKQAREQECRARNAQAKLQPAGARGNGPPRGSRAESPFRLPTGEGEDPARSAAYAAEFIAQAEDPVAVAGMWYSLLEDVKDPSSCVLEFFDKLTRCGLKWDEETRLLLSLIDAAVMAPESEFRRRVQAALLCLRPPGGGRLQQQVAA
jgi:hypothetical protein